MNNINRVYIFAICLSLLSCTAFANKNYVPPSQIEHIAIFPDEKILTVSHVNNKELYHIGEINGPWSDAYQVSVLGMEYVTFALVSDDGVYISGEVANKKPGSNTYYTGRTVLLDTHNKIKKFWNHDIGFNSAYIYNNEVIGSTGNKIYKLLKTGEVKILHKRKRKTLITLATDKKGELIICNSLPVGKVTTIGFKFGCYKGNDWEFSGSWFGANSDYHTTPIVCGNWLIEAVQKKYRTDFSKLKVRHVNTGEIATEQEITQVTRFSCADDNHILFNTSNTGYSLPDLKPTIKYSCHNNEIIKSIKQSGELTVCLTEQGNIGKLITIQK